VDIVELANKLGGASFATLLVAILIGSYKQIWVWGYQLQRAEQDGKEWKAMAMQGIGMAEKSITVAKSVQSAQP
jgi:hypothetical protein